MIAMSFINLYFQDDIRMKRNRVIVKTGKYHFRSIARWLPHPIFFCDEVLSFCIYQNGKWNWLQWEAWARTHQVTVQHRCEGAEDGVFVGHWSFAEERLFMAGARLTCLLRMRLLQVCDRLRPCVWLPDRSKSANFRRGTLSLFDSVCMDAQSCI